MKKCLIILLLSILLILPLATALEFPTHQTNTTLRFSITSNNATGCNLTTINTPNGVNVINQAANKTFQTFNFTLQSSNYSEFGTYCHQLECTDDFKITSGEKCYEINYLGKELTESQSTLYIALIAILIFTLFATFWGMGHLPASNEKDEFGRLLSISYLKYFRLPLWLFAWFLFLGIIYLCSNIAFAFLPVQLAANITFAIFIMMFAVSPIIVIILMISFFVKFSHDKEFQQYFNRGIYPGADV